MITLLFYPPKSKYCVHEGGGLHPNTRSIKTKFSVVKIEEILAATTLALLPQPSASLPPLYASIDSRIFLARPTWRHGGATLRLVELSNRTSAVLESQAADFLLHNDPIVSVFRTYFWLPAQDYRFVRLPCLSLPSTTSRHCHCKSILPPCRNGLSERSPELAGSGVRNPFEGIFIRLLRRIKPTLLFTPSSSNIRRRM
ncbi:hypothetical protein R3P38DRAFT_1114759 [Favolaschia claudopus]|uniref:Uncharacterized protein n=1 Tax=Favolaschia claudopus TaxID=2862362 RepID=A0AAW0B9I7_9AGAR